MYISTFSFLSVRLGSPLVVSSFPVANRLSLVFHGSWHLVKRSGLTTLCVCMDRTREKHVKFVAPSHGTPFEWRWNAILENVSARDGL